MTNRVARSEDYMGWNPVSVSMSGSDWGASQIREGFSTSNLRKTKSNLVGG